MNLEGHYNGRPILIDLHEAAKSLVFSKEHGLLLMPCLNGYLALKRHGAGA